MRSTAALFLLVAMAFPVYNVLAQETGSPAPARHITVQEAVQLALKHNHDIRITGYAVEQKEHAKQAEKSRYFPSIRNDTNFLHVTDTQLIEIRSGSLGTAGGTPIPAANEIINQGGKNFVTSGTLLTQPLTTLLKIKRENDLAQAELVASRQKAQLAGNDVALAVHQVYYKLLITQTHRRATEERVKASEALQNERVQQVKFGSALEQESIDSRAQLLQAQQEILTADLQLSDLKLELNDLIGLPLNTALDLDPALSAVQETCRREECVAAAESSRPEILAARAEVQKAEAAVRLQKTDNWVPDIDAFARYGYAENVPFLARNSGSFGIHFSYDLFDSGRKKALLHERQSQLSQAKENLAKVTDAVELLVNRAYNKLDRTQQMLKVSEEVVALRTESDRIMQQRLLQIGRAHV